MIATAGAAVILAGLIYAASTLLYWQKEYPIKGLSIDR